MQNEITYNLECCVLGSILIDREAMPQVNFLQPECFHDANNREVFSAAKDMFIKNEPIDLVLLTNKIYRQGKITKDLTPSYICSLTNYIASPAHIKHHALKLVEYYVEREMMNAGIHLTKEANWEDSILVYNKTESKIREIITALKNSEYKSSYEVLNSVLKDLGTQAEFTGVPSGFTKLDRITGGFQNTDLYILAARPSMGKTAFMLSVARNAAIDFNMPIGIFSFEMSSSSLMKRLLSIETEFPLERIIRRQLNEQWTDILKKAGEIATDKIILDDSSAGSYIDLKTKTQKMIAEKGVKMIIVDYIQLMKPVENKKNTTRDLEMGEIAYGLKTIAKEFKIPVIALSQLSRKVEERGDKRPLLSDLRESGNLEQAADTVMFLYRPEYYGIDEDMHGNSTKGYAELIIGKNRNGSLDNISLNFTGEFTKFTDYEGELINFDRKKKF